jgi:hypothetical protein
MSPYRFGTPGGLWADFVGEPARSAEYKMKIL